MCVTECEDEAKKVKKSPRCVPGSSGFLVRNVLVMETEVRGLCLRKSILRYLVDLLEGGKRSDEVTNLFVAVTTQEGLT